MTDGSSSRSNSEPDQLRLLNGPPAQHQLRRSVRRQQREPARGQGGGPDQWGPAPQINFRGVCLLRETVSTHARLAVCVGGIPTRWTTRTPRILAALGFPTPYQHRPRVSGCKNKIIRFGLARVSYIACKSLPVPTLSLSHSLTHTLSNSDTWLTRAIFLWPDSLPLASVS
jgi:hypothetical protein